MATTIEYTCPFCGLPTLVTADGISTDMHKLWIKNADGEHILWSRFRICPNPKCKKFSLEAALNRATRTGNGDLVPASTVKYWMLVPPSSAKAFPSYIPQAIRADYEEACLIREGSPKASATLCRRCLQGMIRDFWHIQKDSLKNEIDALKGKVEEDTWRAIDAVRSIGNIGAHMEKDVNVIVDVEPDEAEKLIWLIELLMKEWYIRSEERRVNLAEIEEMAKAKQLAKTAPPSAAAAENP